MEGVIFLYKCQCNVDTSVVLSPRRDLAVIAKINNCTLDFSTVATWSVSINAQKSHNFTKKLFCYIELEILPCTTRKPGYLPMTLQKSDPGTLNSTQLEVYMWGQFSRVSEKKHVNVTQSTGFTTMIARKFIVKTTNRTTSIKRWTFLSSL